MCSISARFLDLDAKICVAQELANPRPEVLKVAMNMAVRSSALFHKPVEAACSSRRSSSCAALPLSRNPILQSYRPKTLPAPKSPFCCFKPENPSNEHNDAMRLARKQFYEEITYRRNDRSISLGKAALLICAEDEAYVSANKEKDMLALQKEGRKTALPPKAVPTDPLLLEGSSLNSWLGRIDSLAEEVEASLTASKNPLSALNAVRKFNRKSSLTTDPKNLYLHQVLKLGSGTAIMLGIICIEICQRLGLELQGAPLGEDFILWPSADESKICKEGLRMGCLPFPAEMVFEPFKGGKIWFRSADAKLVATAANGSNICIANSGMNLEPVSKRAILTILLRSLKRLYWKRASRALAAAVPEITAPLHPLVLAAHGNLVRTEQSPGALLRPQELRLALAASEKLLLLQPQDWATRRDHGLLLYHSRRYSEAVQELSICLAVAPVQEVQILEPFVEKLHLLRVESSWASFTPNTPSALA